MSIAASEPRREAIRGALARGAGEAADARAVAEATLRTGREMSARLAPVIGARGVDVLFGRALHLTSAAFPWLAGTALDADEGAQLERAGRRLGAAEPAVAAEAGSALLLTFAELLESLIGESLTGRLLDPVWAPPSPASEKGNPP